ncbi:hypothetical protein E4T56_gene14443 [Termitomyces sp. T112]|nr:hypothetical protein E4T56_gene14443 [Termitomyces sp. T112]KAH0591331.1 hypothetical protein H2248_001410 [Termitomyces sp. 'cryptogamus']
MISIPSDVAQLRDPGRNTNQQAFVAKFVIFLTAPVDISNALLYTPCEPLLSIDVSEEALQSRARRVVSLASTTYHAYHRHIEFLHVFAVSCLIRLLVCHLRIKSNIKCQS